MNLVLLLVFATVVIKVTLCNESSKCCGFDEILIKDGNSSYECTKDTTQRHQILARTTEYLKNSISGRCLDVVNDTFVEYSIDTNNADEYKGVFFPKCCPLNRIYNTNLHSCIENITIPLNYINNTFVKIGLTECKLITDFELKEKSSFLDAFKKRMNSVQDFNSFCFDRTEKGSFVLRECQKDLKSCKDNKCVKKCCPDGKSFVNGSKCVDTYEYGLNLSHFSRMIESPQEKYAIVYNRTCRQIYRLPVDSNITIHRNGSFSEMAMNRLRTVDVTESISYCLEHLTKYETNGYYFFHCFSENIEYTKFDSRKWPLTLSCIFLILTIIVYIIIKEYKKMFGKILINYCFTSFLLFAMLLWIQINYISDHIVCEIKSFVLIFLALAQFTWANVMCFEIWCTFGTTKMYIGTKHKEIELRKFVMYSLYAWGVPLVLTLTVFMFHRWRILPDAVQPYLANRKCFFERKPGNYAQLLFFSVPLLVIQMINMAFFVKTVIYCMKVKNDINKINDAARTHSARKFQHDRERLILITKLSIVMAISYIFEVGTSFVNMSQLGDGPKYTEIVLDVYNALQGVFIFIIFICKRKVIFGCLQKFNIVQHTQNSTSTRTQSSLTLNGVVLSSIASKDKFNNNKI